MHILLCDLQAVSENESTLFELTQGGTVDLTFVLNNQGINTMNYRFVASLDGTAYTALGVAGTVFYSTLMPGQSRSITVPAATQRLRLVGNASGGALLDFSISRFYSRASGGYIPTF